MARKWSGFVPQNLAAKEEWEMLEACESKARRNRAGAAACEEAGEKGLESQDSLGRRVSFGVAKDK